MLLAGERCRAREVKRGLAQPRPCDISPIMISPWVPAFVVLAACGHPARDDRAPAAASGMAAPVVAETAPPAADAPPPAPGTPAPAARVPSGTPDLDCYANGPKEYVQIATDRTTMTGLLRRVTTRPIPTREIRYRVVARGDAVDLVFDGYAAGDYARVSRTPPSPPRERLIRGRSVIATVAVDHGHSRIFVDRDVDLGTGMSVPPVDGSYPCTEW